VCRDLPYIDLAVHPSMHLSIDGISSPVYKTFDCHSTSEKFLLPLEYCLRVPSLAKREGYK
jgi:hypothetical protein